MKSFDIAMCELADALVLRSYVQKYMFSLFQVGCTDHWDEVIKEVEELKYQPDEESDKLERVPAELIMTTVQVFNDMRKVGLSPPSAVYALDYGTIWAEWHYADKSVISVHIPKPNCAHVHIWTRNKKSIYEELIWPSY